MKQKFLIEAKRMARDAGYHEARRVGIYKEYSVMEPIFTDGKFHFIGIPQYILYKEGKLRWTKDYQESLDIIDAISR